MITKSHGPLITNPGRLNYPSNMQLELHSLSFTSTGGPIAKEKRTDTPKLIPIQYDPTKKSFVSNPFKY